MKIILADQILCWPTLYVSLLLLGRTLHYIMVYKYCRLLVWVFLDITLFMTHFHLSLSNVPDHRLHYHYTALVLCFVVFLFFLCQYWNVIFILLVAASCDGRLPTLAAIRCISLHITMWVTWSINSLSLISRIYSTNPTHLILSSHARV